MPELGYRSPKRAAEDRPVFSLPIKMPPAWVEGMPCASDPDSWFEPWGVDYAKEICADCERRVECRDWAIENDEQFGIWGGLTPGDRYRLRRGKSRRAA